MWSWKAIQYRADTQISFPLSVLGASEIFTGVGAVQNGSSGLANMLRWPGIRDDSVWLIPSRNGADNHWTEWTWEFPFVISSRSVLFLLAFLLLWCGLEPCILDQSRLCI